MEYLTGVKEKDTLEISQLLEKAAAGQKVKVKILNTNDNKISLSMKALEEEMVDTKTAGEVEEYISNETAGTSLGDLLSKFKF